MIQTDLIGEYVTIPDEGDAGWIRALFVSGNLLYALIQRDNASHDLKTYYILNVVVPRKAL